MNLESSVNELLLDLFEFQNGVQFLLAFHSLKSRFEHLLFPHFRSVWCPLSERLYRERIFQRNELRKINARKTV